MAAPISKEQALIRFKEQHGTKYKYPHLAKEYVNSSTKITIVCPIHGAFQQRPISHWKGTACPECGLAKRASSKTKSLAVVRSILSKSHPMVRFPKIAEEYKNGRSKLTAYCMLHHIEFRPTVMNLIKPKPCGCPECGYQKISDNYKGKIETFANFEYLDDLSTKKRSDMLHIRCTKHNCEFFITGVQHSQQKYRGCPECRSELSRVANQQKFSESFFVKVKEIYGERLDFSNSKYVDDHVRIEVRCTIHNEVFMARPGVLVRKGQPVKGCIKCRSKSFRAQRGRGCSFLSKRHDGFDGRMFLKEYEWETYHRRLPDRQITGDHSTVCMVCGKPETRDNRFQHSHKIGFAEGIITFGLTPDYLDGPDNIVSAHTTVCNKAAELLPVEICLFLNKDEGVESLPSYLPKEVLDLWDSVINT